MSSEEEEEGRSGAVRDWSNWVMGGKSGEGRGSWENGGKRRGVVSSRLSEKGSQRERDGEGRRTCLWIRL
jgi:hypothetical protein